MTNHDCKNEIDDKLWIGDSGASCHYCNNKKDLYNYTSVSEELLVGIGNTIVAKKVGNLSCTFQQKNGKKLVIMLNNLKNAPDQ